jgi:hypothetical protein
MKNVFLINQFDTYVLNIGMSDNLLSIEQITQYLKLSSHIIKVKKSAGTWEGKKEVTYIIVLGTKLRHDYFDRVLQTLCLISNQFCIAYKSNGTSTDKTTFVGNLSFNPSLYRNEIKDINFDESLFINY